MNEKGNRYALSALKQKRTAIAGEVLQLKRQITKRKRQLIHVDATLKLLDPDVDTNAIPSKRPRHVNLFRSGELSRLVLGAFRESEFVTIQMITDRIAAMDGFGEDARKAIKAESGLHWTIR